MRKTKVEFSLDRASITKAVRELEDYKKNVTKRIRQMMEKLVQAGAVEAVQQLSFLAVEYNGTLFDGVETGALADSIYGAYDPNTHVGFIRAGEGLDSEYGYSYAFYVEYGTGYAGEMNPHPNTDGVWEYDVNEHGEEGWYFGGWKTNGRPAMPFMTMTAQEIEGICKKLAKEVFS